VGHARNPLRQLPQRQIDYLLSGGMKNRQKKPAGRGPGGFNLKNFFQEVIEETVPL
jgi:hypothetical protein